MTAVMNKHKTPLRFGSHPPLYLHAPSKGVAYPTVCMTDGSCCQETTISSSWTSSFNCIHQLLTPSLTIIAVSTKISKCRKPVTLRSCNGFTVLGEARTRSFETCYFLLPSFRAELYVTWGNKTVFVSELLFSTLLASLFSRCCARSFVSALDHFQFFRTSHDCISFLPFFLASVDDRQLHCLDLKWCIWDH